ncbi:hypothetical protein [Flavobacterium phage FCOV-F18]|uniref:HNH nuclease domain-containing protein n=10 Tax=Ficleduovirus FCV1 TaxID=2560474 RepID=A0A218M8L1_9CAUD|nr:hypothetical protein FDG55_gp61 [Flavobacterium phage FCV-1]ASD51643.1 hypothetical protein [Flavobacterium phage FCV-3]ASD51717.1 hypothetical protein [Flavobacterium phage FCV-11]ASD51791.1 hypothetical protein [Flavobacterium phage V175]ASD51869.1 hypothetical protein [Flavobacterium phage V181]ASD52547.1 hypothetical protein [Flavobacterium phage FCV-10]ASD52620.1 hypothetical protein [Flavobacterium phage FCV-16]ASD52694.1 hypothetical protein [Flavobacterium phage FCV-20]ASD52924.1
MENLENEIWVDVKGYESLYQVSNLGRIKSLNYNKKKITKELKIQKNNKGYFFVYLCNKTKPKRFYIHRLVAIAFLNYNNLDKKFVIDHIDGNPSNNKLNNLQIITHRHNISKSLNFNHTNTGVQKRRNKYSVNVKLNNKNYYLGLFYTLEEAEYKYQKAIKDYESHGLYPNNVVNFYSKVKGVSYNINKCTWIAYDYANKKRIHIGTFNSEKEAIKAKLKYDKNYENTLL